MTFEEFSSVIVNCPICGRKPDAEYNGDGNWAFYCPSHTIIINTGLNEGEPEYEKAIRAWHDRK